MEWSIQELARAAKTTSRTLRYYDEIDLLKPSRVGENGYRFYDEPSLVRLLRILLLRRVGMGIADIGRVLGGEQDEATALARHRDSLVEERADIDRVIAAVEATLRKLERGEALMPEDVFAAFDHTSHREEVIERWGSDSYARGHRWWTSLSDEEQEQHRRRQEAIAADFGAALLAGKAADSDEVQAIAARQVDWIARAAPISKPYLLGLGEAYVSDPRFAANYDKHGPGTAVLVRDALAVYAERRDPEGDATGLE